MKVWKPYVLTSVLFLSSLALVAQPAIVHEVYQEQVSRYADVEFSPSLYNLARSYAELVRGLEENIQHGLRSDQRAMELLHLYARVYNERDILSMTVEENVAWAPRVETDPVYLRDFWKPSPTHSASVYHPDNKKIGIAIIYHEGHTYMVTYVAR